MRSVRALLLLTSTALASAATVSCSGDDNSQLFSDVVGGTAGQSGGAGRGGSDSSGGSSSGGSASGGAATGGSAGATSGGAGGAASGGNVGTSGASGGGAGGAQNGGAGGVSGGGAGGASGGSAGGSSAGAGGASGGGAGGSSAGAGGASGGVSGGGSGGVSGGGSGGAGGVSGGGAGGVSGGGAGGVSGGGGSGGGPECAGDVDCDALFGPAPCGVWACNGGACEAASPNCADADQDGFGAGASCACAGLDCDDDDDTVGASATRRCYSGPPNTDGVGTCQAGTETCSMGAWGQCTGQIVPSAEACNNEDDDCNGAADDGLGDFTCGLGACQTQVAACANGIVGRCSPPAGALTDGCDGQDNDCDGAIDENCPSCIAVSGQLGNDQTADGTSVLPFKTIQAGIDFAAANPQGPQIVCVALGSNCTQSRTYILKANETLTMADGVSVYGNYEETAWTRCLSGTTAIQPQTAEGVTFPDSVMSPTVLDGFQIDRFATGNVGTSAGITVDGAQGAIISGVTIIGNQAVTANSYGVNVVNDGDVTITRSRIDGGNGTSESIGVRVIDSHVWITNNCLSLNAQNRCDDGCGSTNPAIRGRATPGSGVGVGVLLDDAPLSVIETSAICSNSVEVGAGIRIRGDASGTTVRANLIQAVASSFQSHGVAMDDCAGAAPWIVDNFQIAANGTTDQTLTDGVRAMGACHPIIDSNVRITGGGEGTAANPNGVHCGFDANNNASQCVVVGNDIRGSLTGFPQIATGVRCDFGGCMRVANNTITGRGGKTSFGVWLEQTPAFVGSNVIRGGCSAAAIGVHSQDAWARLENNFVSGFSSSDCAIGANPGLTESTALRVVVSNGSNEIDVHSNTIDATGIAGLNTCTSVGINLGVTGSPPPAGVGLGIFRNNIVLAGQCALGRYGVRESAGSSDPRVFENNNLDPFATPTALYLDETASPLTSPAAVNALTDMLVGGVIANDSLFLSYPSNLHLLPGSPCDALGTPVGAPLLDFDADDRDLVTPDIGADEL